MLLATLGMLLMVSAASFLSLYMGLELQSLALYVLAAFNRDHLRSTEAGLKYFVLGALSSGMMLYGISLIYGFTGSTQFSAIAAVTHAGVPGLGVIFGIVFLIAGLAFKVSAVPFHMWTPDVYEGAPTPVTAYFATAAKVAALCLFLRAILTPFPDLLHQWRQIIVFISVLSMALGAIAAIGQKNIKRLMAYSSIGHMGYALLGLAAGTALGARGVLIYLAIYVFTNLGVFAAIQAMQRKGKAVENISDLAGLARNDIKLASVFAVLFLSLAGLPPLAGFFAKFYVFLAAIQAGLVVACRDRRARQRHRPGLLPAPGEGDVLRRAGRSLRCGQRHGLAGHPGDSVRGGAVLHPRGLAGDHRRRCGRQGAAPLSSVAARLFQAGSRRTGFHQ